jgi:NTE family protein
MSSSAQNTKAEGRHPFIALALSGGGARAMAFHLGCLRALHDRGILAKVRVISTVSGGSVLGAYYAYGPADFETFEKNVVSLLRSGIQGAIAREVLFTAQLPKILGTLLVTGSLSVVLGAAGIFLSLMRRLVGLPTIGIERGLAAIARSLPIWASVTTAFERALARRLFGSKTMVEVARSDLEVVINACDLRTGTAFRFGSRRSSGWRYGEIAGRTPSVAKAVAASAAFPILLPPLIETFDFRKGGREYRDTVALTDGGVFENLGVAVLEPGRSQNITVAYPTTHIISLNAGAGQMESEGTHFWWIGRVGRSFSAVHRKVQDATYQRLHKFAESGELEAFGMIYLGQQDNRLPWSPPDLVRREEVSKYPTDFAPISRNNLELLTKRGEQLTQIIVDRYLSQLGD